MNYWAITFRASLGAYGRRNSFKFIYMMANYVHDFMTLCQQIRFFVMWIWVAGSAMSASQPR